MGFPDRPKVAIFGQKSGKRRKIMLTMLSPSFNSHWTKRTQVA